MAKKKTIKVLNTEIQRRAALRFIKSTETSKRLNKVSDNFDDELSKVATRAEFYVKNISGFDFDSDKHTVVSSVDDDNVIEIYNRGDFVEASEFSGGWPNIDVDSQSADEIYEELHKSLVDLHEMLPDPLFSFKTNSKQRETIANFEEEIQTLSSKYDMAESKYEELVDIQGKMYCELEKACTDDPIINMKKGEEVCLAYVEQFDEMRLIVCDSTTALKITDNFDGKPIAVEQAGVEVVIINDEDYQECDN